MKKKIALTAMVLMVLFLMGCENDQKNLTNPTVTDEEIEMLEAEIERLEASITELEDALETEKAQEKQDDGDYRLYKQHYHSMEFYEDVIYAIFRKGDPQVDDDWTDTLWRLSPKETKQIFEGRGLDFRVSPDETTIAVETDQGLSILDIEGHVIKTFSKSDLDPAQGINLWLRKWNASGTVLWLESKQTYVTGHFIKLDTTSWKIELYDNLFVFSDDYDLNPNTGQVVFSDYPVFFDVEARNEYFDSLAKTNLYYYDLNRQKTILIDAVEINQFNPKWITDDRFTYMDNSEVRVYELQKKVFPAPPVVNLEDLPQTWRALWHHISTYEGRLTKEEVQAINQLFTPMLEHSDATFSNPIACFFTSQYDSLEDLDFVSFLRYYPYGEVPETLPEFEDLMALDYWPFKNFESVKDLPVPVHRYDYDVVNETLEIYGGISLKNLRGMADDQVIYLASTNAFYNYTSDFAPGYFEVTSGEVIDGMINLYGKSNDGTRRQLILVPKDNQYVIQSFRQY